MITPRWNPNALALTSLPPVVTPNVTVNPLAAGQFWAATNGSTSAGGYGNAAFSCFGGANYRLNGTAYPDANFLTADTYSQGSPSQYSSLNLRYSFMHSGSRFAIFYKGTGTSLLIKVNDQFVSLTPIVAPNDGTQLYALLDFGCVDLRRIDIIGRAVKFGGIWTDINDMVTPAQKRGPRMVVMADSFGEGTGNEVSAMFSWIMYLSEYLGWDDVVASAVGSTGLIANPSPKLAFPARAYRDVGCLKPDIVWVCQSLNDSLQSDQSVLQAAQALVAEVQRVHGNWPQFVFSSPTLSGGPIKINANLRAQNATMRNWCGTQGYLYVDDMEMVVNGNYTPHTTTLTAGYAIGATSIATASPLIAGACYRTGDGSVFNVRSVSGTTATIDYLTTAQASGAALTQCGAPWLTGSGHAGAPVGWGSADVCVSGDGVHPLDRGHRLKGYVDASIFIKGLGG